MNKNIPQFFVFGAAKCGTTALTTYLSRHPDIAISSNKEPMFFGSDLDHSWKTNSLDEYLSFFSHAKDNQIRGEGSVWYLFSKKAAQEIIDVRPDAKLIIMLRDPAEAAISLHNQFVRTLNEDILDAYKAVSSSEKRRNGMYIPKNSHFPAALDYISVFNYAEQLEYVFSVFSKPQVHIVFFDDFIKNTENEMKKIYSFLGVKIVNNIKFEKINESRQVRFMALRSFILKPPPVIKKIVIGLLGQTVYQKLDSFRNKIKGYTLTEKRKDIDQNKGNIKKLFVQNITNLEVFLKTDLSRWKQNN